MNALDLVREYHPEATDEQADHLLWEHTGFPGFFEGDPIATLRKQIAATPLIGCCTGDDDWAAP